jgi:hypothetical protein
VPSRRPQVRASTVTMPVTFLFSITLQRALFAGRRCPQGGGGDDTKASWLHVENTSTDAYVTEYASEHENMHYMRCPREIR